MASEADWAGVVSGRTEPSGVPEATMVLSTAPDGGSGAFLVLAGDQRRWWLKALNNGQDPRVTITEFIVGKMAALIGAPACEVSLVRVPDALIGPSTITRTPVVAGLACGSLDVPGVQNSRKLNWRDRDHNRLRHAGVYALYDWCAGDDHQWLYSGAEDMKLYSHDHGHYLTSHRWTPDTLRQGVACPRRPPFDASDLDRAEVERLSNRLSELTREEIAGVLRQVPVSWPITDPELETLGWFLEERAPAAAARLRNLS